MGCCKIKRKSLLFFVPLVLTGIFLLLPFPGEAATKAEKEILLGRKAGEEIEKSFPRARDARIEARMQMILQRLVRELDTEYDYEVRLVEEERPNAFALPGGLIYVNRGMMDFVRTDHELAGIMAHEMIHVERSHGIQQAARNQKLNLLSLAVIAASGGQGAAIILSGVAHAAIAGSYSREYEEQADREGLMLLRQAGYEPTGMVTVMERLYEEGWKHPYRDPGVYLDHPETEDRVAYLIQTMKDRGWPLRRKESLGLLRPSWVEEDGVWVLGLDGTPRWRISSDDISDSQRQQILQGIREALEMETLPYEISLEESPSASVLQVGNRVLCNASSRELQKALPSLREALVQALDGAKRKHPLGSYLQ